MTAAVVEHDLPVRTDWLALDALLRRTAERRDYPDDPAPVKEETNARS